MGTDQPFIDDERVQAAVRALFVGTAPERQDELDALWTEFGPKFQLMGDAGKGAHPIMDAGAYRYVRFNHRVIRAFWIAGFTAWEGYRAVAESPTLDTVDLTRFTKLLSLFEEVLTSERPDEVSLPPGVPEPGPLDRTAPVQDRAAAELSTFAVGWALLHEVRHLQHQQRATSADPEASDPARRHEEELSCDEFATKFILDQLEDYARSAGASVNLVRQKRQLGVYFALFGITLLAKDRWEATNTHPAVRSRINATRANMASPPSEVADSIAHCAFVALRALWPNAPTPFRAF